jgi:hypothetical protein
VAGGLGIGQSATLKAEGANHLVAGPQLMVALAGSRLDPEEFLAGDVRYRAHGHSVRSPTRGPNMRRLGRFPAADGPKNPTNGGFGNRHYWERL